MATVRKKKNKVVVEVEGAKSNKQLKKKKKKKKTKKLKGVKMVLKWCQMVLKNKEN